MNFIEFLATLLTGWLACFAGTYAGYRALRPYLDRRMLPLKPKTDKQPETLN